MHVVYLYAAILALLFVALSVRTLRLRASLQIAVGDNGNKAMLRASRVHGNFAEYVPLCLMLLYFAEAAGLPGVAVHVLGACLVAGRVSHAWGVSQLREKFKFRVFGMVMTFACLLVSAVYLLYRQWA